MNKVTTSKNEAADNMVRQEIEQFIEKKIEETSIYSGHLSTVLRQLAFGEAALLWFSKEQFNLPIGLISIGWGFLLLYFAFDAMQYFFGYQHAQGQVSQYLKDFKSGIRDLDHYMNQTIPHISISMFKWKIAMMIISSTILVFCFSIGIYCRP